MSERFLTKSKQSATRPSDPSRRLGGVRQCSKQGSA